jgi:hypothetical protein
MLAGINNADQSSKAHLALSECQAAGRFAEDLARSWPRAMSGYEAEADKPKISADFRSRPNPFVQCTRLGSQAP